MKPRLLLAVAVMALALGLAPEVARADAGLQLNPLQYEDTLASGHVKAGYVDVANPSDMTVAIATSVQGFRQSDTDGNLSFFDEPDLAAGIKPGLDRFELGPRESIRVTFSVDPARLPKGGVYAVLFFRTLPPTPEASTSYVAESANVGTLLMLQNGTGGAHNGRITQFKLPFFQFGAGLKGGQLQYHNTNPAKGGIAFNPALDSRVLPWGRAVRQKGPFIMPGASRNFELERPGSYMGLLPVTVTDIDSGKHLTRWVLACTGLYQPLVLLIAAAGLLWFFQRRRKPRQPALSWWLKLWRKLRRRKRPIKRAMDGLSGPSR